MYRSHFFSMQTAAGHLLRLDVCCSDLFLLFAPVLYITLLLKHTETHIHTHTISFHYWMIKQLKNKQVISKQPHHWKHTSLQACIMKLLPHPAGTASQPWDIGHIYNMYRSNKTWRLVTPNSFPCMFLQTLCTVSCYSKILWQLCGDQPANTATRISPLAVHVWIPLWKETPTVVTNGKKQILVWPHVVAALESTWLRKNVVSVFQWLTNVTHQVFEKRCFPHCCNQLL